MKKYAFALSIAFISAPTFASDAQKDLPQNPSCPKTMTEEIYNQMKAGTYPGLQVKRVNGMRHSHYVFKWDVPDLVLVQGNLNDLKETPETSKNFCYYVEERSPKNNLIIVYLE